MIITRTPVRISFLGGGTDYPDYFLQHGGATLATTINKYTYITLSHLTKFFDHRIGIYYSTIERVKTIEEIKHPAVRECLRYLNIEDGVEIHVASDLPARTGLGSSSSFTVGLLKALHAFKGEMIDSQQLAAEAVHVEQQLIKERVGCQDQYSCTFGGLQHLEFLPNFQLKSNPIVMSQTRMHEFSEHLMLFYTEMQRTAHEVVEEQIDKTKSGAINEELHGLKKLVKEGIQILSSDRNLLEFGDLLHEGWQLKRRCSSKISNPYIDELYQKALNAGARGGKLLGAGSGGFILLLAEPGKKEKIRAALPHLKEVKFSFDNLGSTIIFYQPE
jgi:D-glycero-alpha-D-manno-heptose-7-phosphate kinase